MHALFFHKFLFLRHNKEQVTKSHMKMDSFMLFGKTFNAYLCIYIRASTFTKKFVICFHLLVYRQVVKSSFEKV